MKNIITLSLILFFGIINAQKQWFETYSDSIKLVSDAQIIANKISKDAKNLIPDFPEKIPVIKDTTPYLIFVNEKGVHLPFWEEVIPPQKDFFYQMAGNEKDGKKLFGLMFNGFYLAHELGHKIAEIKGIKFSDEYESEYFANQFAIAWWKENGYDKQLKEAYDLLLIVLPKMKNPVPDGQTIAQYFTENYNEAASQPAVYGYMQFNQFKEIYEDKSLPTFEALISGLKNK